ncbi:MAG: hypothetical protein F6K19_40085 [Cyanothece sp. SIO1E1]|nr:hypothetical protein [Cyanothece sp. SIO1E1]
MLVSSKLSQVPTVQRLVNIWAARYFPNLSLLPISKEPLIWSELQDASSAKGRTHTIRKLHTELIDRQCELAAVRTINLYAPNGTCDYIEAARLAKSAKRIYLKLFEVYRESSPIVISSRGKLWETFGDASLEAWGIPKIDKLADKLEPLLLELQEQYTVSKNWQSLGFITTQINLSNALFLEGLRPTEKVLITPYFKFLEEQFALPWQRVCAAAAEHNLTSPTFTIVEQMLPIATEISVAVFNRWLKAFPHYSSCRGSLNNPGIKHSSLRDFDMFQAYLWLCFLEGNLTFVKQELAAICTMVFGILNIPWTMTVEGNKFLMNEISNRLEPHQERLVRPYTQGMIQAFPDK